MLNLSTATRIFVALEAVDLRQSFNGLQARVQSVLQQDPLSDHLFVFTNRSRNRLKLLVWGRFRTVGLCQAFGERDLRVAGGGGPSRCLRPEELNLLIHGLEATPRPNWLRL